MTVKQNRPYDEMLELCRSIDGREMTAEHALRLHNLARQAGFNEEQIGDVIRLTIARMGKDIAKFHPEMVEAEKRRMAEEPPPEPETFGGVLHKLGEWYDKSHWHKLLFWLLLLFSLYAFSHHFWLQPCEPDMVFGGCESYE